MKIHLKKNIFWGLTISLILLFVSSLASYISIKNLIKSSAWVEHSNAVLDDLAATLVAVQEAESSQRGYLLSGDQQYLMVYNRVKPEVNSHIDHIQFLTKDNPVQQKNIERLRSFVDNRMDMLQQVINKRKNEGIVVAESLQSGKDYMDGMRGVMQEMKNVEIKLLDERSSRLNALAGYTPFIIILTAIVAFGITIFFYRRVTSDFEDKRMLQEELELKNKEIQERIDSIENLANQVAQGNYNIRFTAKKDDKIGSLALTLNRMTQALSKSFGALEDKEWMQTGIANVGEKLVGQKTVEQLTQDALEAIIEYTESQLGAIYILHNNEYLEFSAAYGLDLTAVPKNFQRGEGIPGQAILSGKTIMIDDIPEDSLQISFASGKMKPKHITAVNIVREDSVIGVIELGSLEKYTDQDMEFLENISEMLGAAIITAQSRKRLQELLHETQAQSEELQAQTSELENINAELEAQSQKLQASEEELRVQQEELLQSNQELEERSALLEERNEMIRERNEEIEKKSKDLEQSSKYKSEFLANMSHELRTPLNSILLLSKLMADNEQLDKEHVEYAQVIQSSGEGLLTLIDEILDLSKIESGKMQLEITDVAPRELATSMQRLFAATAKNKEIGFFVETDANVPKMVQTDRLRLEQILKNLLSNAFKFTSKGEVSLLISLDEKDEKIIFKVKDTGIGVPADKLNLVFEAFQQADGSTRRKYGGTGLGLSISRELCKLLGGDIKLKSVENEGSEFTLYLPLSYSQSDVAEPVSATGEIANTFQELIVEKDQQPKFYSPFDDDRAEVKKGDKVILIIEDDISFAKILRDYTRSRKYKCIVSVSGEEGLEMAKEYRPTAILLDIVLPGIDGWEVIERLKSNMSTRSIPVHIMSSMKVKDKSLLSGAVDFINKPFALEKMKEVFEKLESALSRYKKVLIVEENKPHAQALAYFMNANNISTQVTTTVQESITTLQKSDIDCAILDMGITDKNGFETLETIKQSEELKNLPIIVFTGKNLSKAEEARLKKYADSIVMKTAHSYQRILDEAGLFLHLVEEGNKSANKATEKPKLSELRDILKDKSILIVDDDVRNIFSLSKALEMQKIKVLTATDGKEALAVLKENSNVDAILMDMMMPNMDGYESIGKIRQMVKYKNTPIISVTAKAMVGDREKCIAAGASDYISKPVDVDQLISLLRVWLYTGNI